MSQHRRRFKQTELLEERLASEAIRLREEARLLPPGAVRDAMIRRARQCETGSHVSAWLRSPGLQPPKSERGLPLHFSYTKPKDGVPFAPHPGKVGKSQPATASQPLEGVASEGLSGSAREAPPRCCRMRPDPGPGHRPRQAGDVRQAAAHLGALADQVEQEMLSRKDKAG